MVFREAAVRLQLKESAGDSHGMNYENGVLGREMSSSSACLCLSCTRQ